MVSQRPLTKNGKNLKKEEETMKTFIVLVVAIVGAAFLLAGCKPKSPEQAMNRIFKDLSRELNLSEVQKTQLLGIKEELMEKGREMHEEKEKMHEDMTRLVLSDRIDPDEVKSEAKKKHAGMEEVFNHAVDRLAEFHSTLSPEQKTQLVKLMDKHKKRRPPWHPSCP
jgi:Spy/CpxP family protein refolding chaperone